MIFSEDLEEYTHWGHCDIDLFFGSFEKFITDDMLEKYDKIFRYGHLSIFKNTQEINRRILDFKGSVFPAKTVLKNKEHYSFDEVTGIDRIYRKHKFPYYTEKPYIDISVRSNKAIRLNDADKNYENQAFSWENGRVLRYYEDGSEIKCDEWLYIHFQKKKMPLNGIDLHDGAFWITINGVMPKTETEITADVISQRNRKLTHEELKSENKSYKQRKMKDFFKKSFYEKYIHLKQRGVRALDSILGL